VTIHLAVVGIPAPQGSKTRMPNGALLEAGSATGRARLVEWRRAVTDQARHWLTAHPANPLAEPVDITLTFRFPATASNPYRHYHCVTPDIDKIVRATLDALTHSGLLADDRYVARLTATKTFCEPGQPPGCNVTVTSLAALETSNSAARRAAARAQRRHAAAR
jgi:crossover junction endodeoxyribonuclease RusA